MQAPAKPKYRVRSTRFALRNHVDAARNRLKKELAANLQKVLLNTSAEVLTEEIVQRYRLNVPVLYCNYISQLEPVQTRLQVSGEQPGRNLRRTGPLLRGRDAVQNQRSIHRCKNLFKYATTGYGNPIEGEVLDDAVVLTHIAKDPVPEAVNKEFQSRLDRIETTLQFSRDSVSD